MSTGFAEKLESILLPKSHSRQPPRARCYGEDRNSVSNQLTADVQKKASEAAAPKTVMIDATYLKAHRTATSLRSKKGG
jgi:hypothetical protein